ncbi:MAG: SIMPL domain-containing protein [Ekhidna sp.]
MRNILIVILISFCTSSFSQSKFIHSIPYIEVTGEGSIEVVPNEIHLSIKLREKNQKKLPIEKWEQQMIDSLTAIGVNMDQLSIQNMSGSMGYNFLEATLKTSKDYTLVLDSPEQIAIVFRKLGSIGIYNVDITKVDHSEMDNLKMKVKVNAVKSAKAKAENMMEELGQDVGSTLFIEEKVDLESDYGYPFDMHYSYTGAAKRALAGSYSEPVSFEKIQLDYQVLVRFEIE